MPYSERAYFDNDHCAHCAAWVEYRRLTGLRNRIAGTLSIQFGV